MQNTELRLPGPDDFPKGGGRKAGTSHKGAIDMANTVIKDRKFAATKTLAAAVVKGQQAEIDQMTALLTG